MLCVARAQEYARAFASEFPRTSVADAAAGGGGDGNFVFQSEVHSIPLKLLSPRSGRFENSPAVSAGLTWFRRSQALEAGDRNGLETMRRRSLYRPLRG